MLDLPEFREQGNAQRGGLEMTCVSRACFSGTGFLLAATGLTVVTLQQDRILVSGSQRMPNFAVDRPEYRERKAQ